MLCYAKSLRSCSTLCDPIDGSPPGSPSLGFSRQEHWSGLPFPSPMHESEKWKWSRSVVSDSSQPHGLQPTRCLRPWDFPGKSTGVGCHCLIWTTGIFYLLISLSYFFSPPSSVLSGNHLCILCIFFAMFVLFFLSATCNRNHMAFVFLCQTYFT